MQQLRIILSTFFLFLCWLFARGFYRLHKQSPAPLGDLPWQDIRVIALLNHTSLYEWLFISALPLRLLPHIAAHAVIPIADITTKRPIIGAFFKLLTRRVIPISRKADHTWQQVIANIDDKNSLILILPEGRMMRENKLDKHGKAMTVRGGIADILSNVNEGQLLLAYSGGLHHVQIPGQRFPRLFKSLHLSIELENIPKYKEKLEQTGPNFKKALQQDLNQRRDLEVEKMEQLAQKS